MERLPGRPAASPEGRCAATPRSVSLIRLLFDVAASITAVLWKTLASQIRFDSKSL